MFWLLAALLTLYAAFLTVTLRADLYHFDTTQCRIILQAGVLHKTWQLTFLRTAQGHRLVLTGDRGPTLLDTRQLRHSRGSLLFDTLRRADRARIFLLRHTRLDRLDALIQIRTEDAARSALYAGGLRSILWCIPAIHRRQVRVRVLPEFFRAYSTLEARCIIRVRLGTIILTAGLLLLSYLREQHPGESEAV